MGLVHEEEGLACPDAELEVELLADGIVEDMVEIEEEED
jgi:hypothetical protein